jgi:hypothetical protein
MADGTALCYSALVDLDADHLGYTWKVTVNRDGEDPFDVEVGDMTDHGSRYVVHTNAFNPGDIPDMYSPWDDYKQFEWAFDQAITSEAGTAGWSETAFTVNFTPTTGKYAISANTAFSLTFTNTATANFFGFSGSLASAASHVSSGVASFCMVPSIDARSGFSREYEPGGISSLAVSDSGRVKKGIARASVPLYMDWQQSFEPKEVIFTEEATGTVFHTWQDFIGHCRQSYPFVVHTASQNFEVHMLRDTASNFTPEPMEVDNHEYFHMNFETHFIGRDPEAG